MDFDHERRLTEVESRSKSNTHRLDDVEKRQDNLDKLVASVSVLKTEQDHIQTDVREIKQDVKGLTEKPAERWDKLISTIIGALAGAFIAWIAAGAPGLSL